MTQVHMEEADLAAWIEATMRGRIVSAQRQGRWRIHWLIDVEMPEGTRPLIARMPRDPAYVRQLEYTSYFDTAHEAAVMGALANTNIPIPRCYGFHQSTETLLIERLPGSASFSDLAPENRRNVLEQYIDHLVGLHALDTSVFRNAGLDVYDTVEDGARGGMLYYARRDFEKARGKIMPEPLLEFALWWLAENVPHPDRPVSILQCDTGPGQFMFEGDRLIALIDWELSCTGDAMLDLGVMRMRNTLYPMGPIDFALERYAAKSGRPLDLFAIRYYTVAASLISLLLMAPSIQEPDARIDSMIPRIAWDTSMRRCLCEALLEVNGLSVAPPDIPKARPAARTSLHTFLVDHLEATCAPVASEPYEQYLMDGAVGIAKTLRLRDQIGAQLDADDLDDIASVVGRRPAERREGDVMLMDLVTTDPGGNLAKLLSLWYRMCVRHETALAPIKVAQGSDPLVPMPGTLGQL